MQKAEIRPLSHGSSSPWGGGRLVLAKIFADPGQITVANRRTYGIVNILTLAHTTSIRWIFIKENKDLEIHYFKPVL